jgi:hypothetical protein
LSDVDWDEYVLTNPHDDGPIEADGGADLRRLLDALGRDPDERMSVNWLDADSRFISRIVTVAAAPALAQRHADGDVWFGVHALRRGATGRGSANDIVGLRSLNADLDIKTTGMPTLEAAEGVIDTLSEMLGATPAAVVGTGHGLQPHWRVERDERSDWPDPSDPRYLNATALYRRWGRLVSETAMGWKGHVDSVFDLARVMRVPGTMNRKFADVPVATTLDLNWGGRRW